MRIKIHVKPLIQCLVHSKYFTCVSLETYSNYTERVRSVPTSKSLGSAYSLNHLATPGIKGGREKNGGTKGEREGKKADR